MITFKNVSKRYNGITVVDKLNLTIGDGEFVVFIGPSGCGKTTSLKMINKLIEMDEGTICIDGRDIKDLGGDQLRRRIGYVIQQIGLFPNLTIEENILVVPRLLKWSKEKCKTRVRELLELVGMPYEENAHKYPNELSGGQQQRIGVLRALAGEPPIILMDEPFGALDPVTRESLQDELKIIQRKLHKTIIFVTHDMGEAIKLADRIVFMSMGKALQIATPKEMIQNPADPIISNFMGKYASSSGYAKPDLTCADVMETDGLNTLASAGNSHNSVPAAGSARDAFAVLLQSKADSLVVLNQDGKVAGMITKNSIAKGLAGLVWGDVDWPS